MKTITTGLASLILAISLSGCTPSLGQDSLEASLTLASAYSLLDEQVEVSLDIEVLDDAVTETYLYEILLVGDSGQSQNIGPFEGSGDLTVSESIVPFLGVNQISAKIFGADGVVFSESLVQSLLVVDARSYSLSLDSPARIWLTEEEVQLSHKFVGNLEIPALTSILEKYSDSEWKEVGKIELLQQSSVTFQQDEESEVSLRSALYLDGQLVTSSPEITMFLQSPETMVVALTYGAQQAASKGTRAWLEYVESITYPDLYDTSNDDWSEMIYFEYVSPGAVTKGTVRPDPAWILPSHSCQVSFLGETPPGKTFIFEETHSPSDRFNNYYAPYKADVHATFHDGKMWIYRPPTDNC